MGIAIANLGPAILFTIGTHGEAVSTDAAETGIPGLNTIKPDILRCMNTIHDTFLTTVTEKAVQWMGYNCQPPLFMDQVDAAFHTLSRLDALFNE